MGFVETNRGPTISLSSSTISSSESMITKIRRRASWGFQAAAKPLELQMTSTRDQDIAAGEHARFIARQECNRSGHILRVEVSLQRAGLTYPLPVLFRHNHRRTRQDKGWGHNVNPYPQGPQSDA